ncbi:cleavage and polyadenylation specificity factor subunit 2, partial [Nowakowskiella sp. JEL0078]
HLNATSLRTNVLERPSILITDAYNSLTSHVPRPQRDTALVDFSLMSLNAQGNVLIPTDSAARVLELIYLLDLKWEQNKIQFPLLSSRTMTLAKRLLDWMRKDLTEEFNQTRLHPFEFRRAHLIHSISDLERYPGPKVVLASLPSLDSGFSKELMLQWGSQPNSLILLPDRGNSGSTTRRFYDMWKNLTPAEESGKIGSPIDLTFTEKIIIKSRIPLEGEELQNHLKLVEQEEKEKAAESQKKRRKKNILDDDDDDDDSDFSDSELEKNKTSKLLKISKNKKIVTDLQFDVYVKDITRSADDFFKQSKTFFMFPMSEATKKIDDYGEIIDPEFFIRGEHSVPSISNISDDEMPMEVDETTDDYDIDITPSKYLNEEKEILFSCKLMYIDFEGRADGKSIKNIIPQIAPRKLILVHGSEQATDDLHKFCLDSNEVTNEIFSPEIGEVLNVSAARNIYRVKLTDSLFSSLKPAQLGNYDLFYVNGHLHVPEAAQTSAIPITSLTRRTDSAYDTNRILPILDAPPLDRRLLHRPVLIGDIKLTDFKNVVQEHDARLKARRAAANNEGSVVDDEYEYQLNCTFENRALVIGRRIVVRKLDSGVLAVEGPLCKEYFKVRSLLYRQLAVL